MYKNVKYEVDSASIEVDPKGTWNNVNKDGVYFDRSYNVGVTLKKMYDNSNVIDIIELENIKYFHTMVKFR